LGKTSTWRTIVDGVEVEVLELNDTVETVEKASRASGEPPTKIAKTLVVKKGDEYLVVIARGDRKIDYKKASKALGHSITLASPLEVRNLTGLEPGALTPIHGAVKRLRVILDPALLEHEYILCGAGAFNRLYKVKTRDLVAYLKPEVIDIFK